MPENTVTTASAVRATTATRMTSPLPGTCFSAQQDRTGRGRWCCAHDPLTGEDHRAMTVNAPADALLIVDSVFAFRPEYNDLWDFRIWLDVNPDLSLARGIARDTDLEGHEQATLLHRDRYHAAELIYLAEVIGHSQTSSSTTESLPSPGL
jgi:hypothetical protein